MRFLRSLCWFLIAGMFSPQSKAMAQDLKVLVLDALNGKPQAHVEVTYFCSGKPDNPASKRTKPVLTNTKGVAEISFLCSDEQKIQISLNPHDRKEQCGGSDTLASQDIVTLGIVSNPDIYGSISCPTTISKKLKPVPGEVIMFVKKPTWWQSHITG